MDAQLKKGLLEVCVLTAIKEKNRTGTKSLQTLRRT